MLTVLNTHSLHPGLRAAIKKKTPFPKKDPRVHFTRTQTILLIGKSHFHSQSLLKATSFAPHLHMARMCRVGKLATQAEALLHTFRQTRYQLQQIKLLNLHSRGLFRSKVLKLLVRLHQIMQDNGFG